MHLFGGLFRSPQNVTLKRLGQDGEGAEAITQRIIRAVEQVALQANPLI
jgi:hypothetical protein